MGERKETRSLHFFCFFFLDARPTLTKTIKEGLSLKEARMYGPTH
jgi:hypothetical protein